MEITPEVSGKIKLLRLPLIIGIVTIHSYINPVGYADKFFQTFISSTRGGLLRTFFVYSFRISVFSEILTYR